MNTPIITSSDCEGGGETFSITTTPSETSRTPEAFFPTPPGANLTVSGQLHLETYLPTSPRLYTLSPTFRAEPSNSSRHLSEFYMLEAEMAFVGTVDGLMDVVEAGVKHVLRGISRGLGREGEAVDEDAGAGMGVFWSKPGVQERVSLAVSRGFRRMSYQEAIDRLADQHARSPFAFSPQYGQPLRTEHEQWLAGQEGGPMFVYDYPADVKAFYMLPNPGTGTVACFDLLVPGLGELAGGSLREHRLEPLLAVME